MAACVIIGERAGELLRSAHKLSGARAHFNQNHSHSRRATTEPEEPEPQTMKS